MKTLIVVCVLLALAATSIQAAKLDNTLLARYLCRNKQDGYRSLVPGSCSQYYECQNGKSDLRSCPRYYDSKNRICVNTNAGCVETLGREIREPVVDCTGPCCGVSNGYVVDTTSAQVYYQCNGNSIVAKQTCAGDLMFDIVKEVCASPSICGGNGPCTATTTPCATTPPCTTTTSCTTTPCTTTTCTTTTSCTTTPCTTTTCTTTTSCTTTPCTTTTCTTTTSCTTTPCTTTTCTTTTSCTTTPCTTTTCTTTTSCTTTPCTTTTCTTTTCTTTTCTTTTCTTTTCTTTTCTTTTCPTTTCTTTTSCTTTPCTTTTCITTKKPCTTTKKPCITVTTPCATTTKAPCASSNNAAVAAVAMPVNNLAYTLPSENPQSNIEVYMRLACLDKPDGFMLASLKRCNEYYICRYGHALPVSCGNKYFNALKGNCDLPENTKCIQS